MCPPRGSEAGAAWLDADPSAAPIVVLAVAVAAVHANGPAVFVGGDHRVHPVGLAGSAEILDRFAGAVTSWVHVGCYDRTTRETHT